MTSFPNSLKKLKFRELDVSPGKTKVKQLTRQIYQIYIPGKGLF